jgi:hypothetical protein
MGREMPGKLACGSFDLNHFRAEIRQDHRCIGTSEKLGEIKDTNAGQWRGAGLGAHMSTF